MKKLVSMFAAIVAAFSFNSCDNETLYEQPEQSSDVTVNISVASLEPDTKAIKKNWANGDKINIWFGSTKITNTPQLVLTYDGTKWTASELSSETINSLQASGGKLRAVYESTNSIFAGSISDGLHRTLSSSRFGSDEVCYAPMCCLSNDVSYTFSSNTLKASINSWVFETNAQVVIAGLDPLQASNYALEVKYVATDSRPVKLWDTAGWFDDTDQRTVLTNSTVSFSGGMSNEDGVAFRFWRMQRLNDLTGDILFTLIHKDASGNIDFTKTFTKNNTTITTWPTNKCTGIKINYSKFIGNLLDGKFTVAAGKQVQFTRGNLYWNGSAFKFETNQTDGLNTTSTGATWNNNHISHLYWTKTAEASYTQPYSDGTNSSSDVPFFAESTGGLTVEGTSGLFALSIDEWKYLLGIGTSRDNASSLAKSGVSVSNNGTAYPNCLIIAPDDYDYQNKPLKTTYTLDEVNALGLVCLPAAGFYYDSSFDKGGSEGYYWSSSTTGKNGGFLQFGTTIQSPGYSTYYDSRSAGQSLRLVKTVE